MMKLFIGILLLTTSSSWAQEPIPSFFSCKEPQKCIKTLLLEEKLWGNFHTNYKLAKSLWNIAPEFQFRSLNKQGEQKLEKHGNALIPLIVLPSIADPFEIVITLNHEIVHYLHLFNLLKFIKDNNKINHCLTAYKLGLLKDEGPAFKEEIIFWEQSPMWFKAHFINETFTSRLLERKVSYAEYYKILKEKIKADPFFIEKRYIDFGEQPKCAMALLKIK